MKSVCIHTVGCKLNYSESSFIAKKFIENGLEVKSFGEKTDIFVLNTCTVTSHAESDCRKLIRGVLRKNPETFVAVIGCYSQVKPNEIENIKGVDLVLGTNNKNKIIEHISRFFGRDFSKNYVKNGHKTETLISDINSFKCIEEAYSGENDGRTRAFLKIQDGCNYNCSFCAIPLARGKSRSLPIEKVIENANKLINAGYKEIILTGVNVGDYKDGIGFGLISLLKKLNNLNINRIRISSIEPNLVDDELIDFINSSSKFCNHFHIPLQSGDDEILKLMRRRYNTRIFTEVLEKIKVKIPNAGIGIDVISGFPGETDNHFKNTYNFINDLPVSYIHIFSYSERPNTLASTFENKVRPEIIKERSGILRELSMKKKAKFYSDNISKTHKVLFETQKNGIIEGWTENYIRVKADSKEVKENEIYFVSLMKTNGTNPVECKIIN